LKAGLENNSELPADKSRCKICLRLCYKRAHMEN